MTEILKIENITKKYGSNTVLKNISFTSESGEIVALIGENGAGKSTLINIINNLTERSSGKVMIFGNTSIKDKSLRERIGVMPQQDISLEKIKVKETINLARSYYKNPVDYKELISLSNLKSKENELVTDLSGGQKRLLSFAVALAGDPDLIFLDEPTNGMDVMNREKFWNTVLKLKNQGKTFFVTSHYIEELQNIATKIMILQNEKFVFQGTLDDLRKDQESTQIQFDSQVNLVNFKKIESIKTIKQNGQHFIITTNNLIEFLKDFQVFYDEISNLSIEQNTLETIFKNLSKGGQDND
ncbi:ABC transporter ATP-binding protein [Companilactobacillus metriopterae]|uniref:ABC transporter ATP-binding protein n=1 Tax=Companilactobacillus metriopterae TaxID=1909267 RepID=UPI00100A90FF|nr:ABC transporter ATP-binding protein [Companilactobacillus metriopterae]